MYQNWKGFQISSLYALLPGNQPGVYIDAKNTLVCIYQYTKNALIFFLMFDLKIVFGYTRWEGSATDS